MPDNNNDPTKFTTAQLDRAIDNIDRVYSTRLDGMDEAVKVLSETVNRTPTVIQVEISHVRELTKAQLDSLQSTTTEKFASVTQQFLERDIRTEQAATANASALAAALQAAKEAVAEQANAAAKAADKTELSFTKLIEQTQLQITTVAEGLGDKIDDLKGRLDRGEGNSSGVQSVTGTPFDASFFQQAEQTRLAAAAASMRTAIISIIAVLITLASVLFAVLHK